MSSVDDVLVKTHKTKSLFTCPIQLMNILQFPKNSLKCKIAFNNIIKLIAWKMF